MYTSSIEQPRDKSFTGEFKPCNTGPTASYPPKRCAILYPILPASKLGNTKTFALPCNLAPGAFFSTTPGTNAASNWNSPSMIASNFSSSAFVELI